MSNHPTTLALHQHAPSPPRPSPKRKRNDSISSPYGVADKSEHKSIQTLDFHVRLKPLPDHLQRSVSPYPPLDHNDADVPSHQQQPPTSTPPNKPALPTPSIDTPPVLPGGSSPRTIVAAQFGELSLSGRARLGHIDGHGRTVKKAKIGVVGETSQSELCGGPRRMNLLLGEVLWGDAERVRRVKKGLEEASSSERGGAVQHTTSSQQPRPGRHHPYSKGHNAPLITHSKENPISPTLSPSTTPPSAVLDLDGLDATSLTWHDSEITGHLALDPDDDGTGINGVGFKPTPAMQYARQLARRRQVAEWKRREAGEERKRRLDMRRRSGYLGKDAEDGIGKGGEEGRGKVVRFA